MRFTHALTLAPLLGIMACGQEQPAPVKSDARAVTVGTVSAVPLDAGLAASGQLVPREEVAVSPDVSGYRVQRVLVEEDASVRQGQVLAVLDGALLAPQVAQAAAQLLQQQVAADRARAEAERVAGLDGKGVLSDEAIAERRLAVRTGSAQVAAARAQLDNLRTQQARLVVRAPRSGRILQRNVRPGDTAQAGTVMFTIARDGLTDLDAELPEASVGRVRIGTPADVQIASGQRFAGQVRLLGARVDPQTGSIKVRVALPLDPALRPGGFAKATFGASGAATLSVPEAALRYDARGSSIQILDADNRVRTTPVHTGARSSGRVALSRGPAAGTRIVLSGGAFLSDGDRVTPVTGTAK